MILYGDKKEFKSSHIMSIYLISLAIMSEHCLILAVEVERKGRLFFFGIYIPLKICVVHKVQLVL